MKKISVISGGTSGLGLEIASLLVKSGKNVLILGRNNVRSSLKLHQDLKKASKNILTESMICNIGKEEDVKKVGKFLTTQLILLLIIFSTMPEGVCLQKHITSTSALNRQCF
jgi:short-subunit dehydrogenase